MTIEPELFRQAMRAWATGVTIVTSTHDGLRHGMTVSSFTSLSVTPPQVLVAITSNVRTHALIDNSGTFGVTLLADHQAEISDRFSGRIPDALDRFEGLETFHLTTGAPLLAAGLACFDCRVTSSFESGDHTIFVGDVLAAKNLHDGWPLVYFNRDYRQLQK
jgi:flavin reductase (DIM6/NTAB) family NADH-FMN oxidoreductase RutF